MRKYVLTSAIYASLGLIAGVLYREMTKLKDFSGRTALGMVHPHLLGLGMIFFLMIGLLAIKLELEKFKTYKAFFITYNVGVAITAITLIVRGIVEVQKIAMSDTASKMISIFAGIGHMTIAAGLVLLFIALFKVTKINHLKNKETQEE